MPLFASRVPKELQSSLEEHLGGRARVLAHADGDGVQLVATPEWLALQRDGVWESWGWEQVAHGGWRVDDSSLRWTTTAGDTVEVQLADVGRLPELFRERVQASTVASETHELERGRVQIVGRRRLDGSDAVTWYASAGGGASLADPVIAEFVVECTDRLKQEYGA